LAPPTVFFLSFFKGQERSLAGSYMLGLNSALPFTEVIKLHVRRLMLIISEIIIIKLNWPLLQRKEVILTSCNKILLNLNTDLSLLYIYIYRISQLKVNINHGGGLLVKVE
jgi:hypothetical protein